MTREFATAETDKRTDTDGTPRMLKQWLSERGLTLAQWRAGQRTGRTAPPASLAGKPKLAIARRRQALIESLRR